MPQHPLHPVSRELRTLQGSAKALGYAMPAEWEPVARVLLSRPHNPRTWPDCLDRAQKQFDTFTKALSKCVYVCDLAELGIETVDGWLRDSGPIFVRNTAGELACHDFIFNAWGGKYADYESDDVIPQRFAAEMELPIWIHNVVLEGGSIDVNGKGTVLTTEQCLLNVNRNPMLERERIENLLHENLGTHHVIWLPGGITGDDTDGHIDDVARFIAEDTVVAPRVPKDHPDYDALEMNWRMLRSARTERGHHLQLIELPMPDPITYNYPDDEFYGPGERLLAASYANFLIANGCIFVPIFGQPTDDVALRILDEATPEHDVIGIRSEFLVVGGGSLHCMTMGMPA